MVFQEPKVEFISIKLSEVTCTSPGVGGGQYCINTEPEATYCPNWEGDVDWATPQS